MRSRTCFALLGLMLLFLSGCVMSDQGLCPPGGGNDAVFDPAHMGDWQTRDDANRPPNGLKIDFDGKPLRITRAEGDAKSYRLGVPVPAGEVVPPDQGPLTAYLVPLGGARFLDVITDSQVKEIQAKGHLLARVTLDGDDLTLSFLDQQFFRDHPQALPGYQAGSINFRFDLDKGLRPQFSGELPRLTASTAELRKFLADHAEDPALWPAQWSIRCRRVPPEPAPTPAPPKALTE